MSNYTGVQLDGLRELANVSSGTAATTLSSLLGRAIDISVPSSKALPLAEAVGAVGLAEAEVTAVVLGVYGSIEALVLMVFSPESASGICSLLGVEPGSEMANSALGEVGNIVGCSYIGAFAEMTGLTLEPRPPQMATDALRAIVATVLSGSRFETDIALVLDTDLVIEGAECSFGFMLVPTVDGIGELLLRLGLGKSPR